MDPEQHLDEFPFTALFRWTVTESLQCSTATWNLRMWRCSTQAGDLMPVYLEVFLHHQEATIGTRPLRDATKDFQDAKHTITQWVAVAASVEILTSIVSAGFYLLAELRKQVATS